jgi:hypothetical protein
LKRPATAYGARPAPPARPGVVVNALLAGLLAWSCGLLFLRYFEPASREIRVGLSGRAAADPLLAAERLLTRLGFPAREARGELKLPPRDHLLVLLHRSSSFARLRKDDLLRWVRQGGRLVVTPVDDLWSGRTDPLLAELGIEVRVSSQSDQTSRAIDRLELPLAPVKAHALVEIRHTPRFADPRHAASYSLSSANGPFLLIVPHGKGDVTVLADGSCFTNRWIGRNDNAALVAWLALGRNGRVPVDLSWRDEMPSLATLLVDEAWTALAPALLLGAALAWRAAARFGPLLPEPPEERRSLMEHLVASGRWLWTSDRGARRQTLVAPLRSAVRERVAARRPAWAKLPERELIQRLGQASGLAPQDVAEALHGSATSDEKRFAAAVQTLALIRRSL